MQDQDKSKDQLIIELKALRQRLSELEKGGVEQKQAEHAIESQYYSSTILQAIPDGFLVLDRERRITDANEAYCLMSGYSRAELLSLNVSDIDAVEEPPVAETRKRRIIGEGSTTFETCHRRKDGSVFDVEVSATYLGMADGRTVCLCRDITGRKQAEAALAKSEQRFSLAMEATKDGLWDWNLLTDEVYYSPGYLAMLGYASGEVPEDVLTWADRIHPEDKDAALKANMDCVENRCDDFEVEFRMQARNGEWRWIMGRGKAAGRDENGRAVRMVGTHTDVTERKQVEEALRQSERNYREIFNTANDAIFVHDADTGTVLDVNDSMLHLYGFSREEALRLSPNDSSLGASPYSAVEVRQWFAKAIEEGPQVFEWHARKKSDELFWVEVALKSANISGQRRMLAIVRDITERKRAEDALQESEERFSRFFRASPVGTSIARWSDGPIVDANDAFLRLFGYTREEVIGHIALELAMWINPEDRTHMVEMLREHGGIRDFETRFRRKSGEIMDALVSAEVIEVAGQQYILGLTHDITERKRAEEALWLHAERVQALLNLNQMADASPKEITDYALEGAVRLTQSKIGYMAFLNDDETILSMHSWSKEAMHECAITNKPIHYNVHETGLWGEAVRQRRMVITNDYAAPSPLKKGYPAGHVAVQRHMNVPVFVGTHIVLVAGVGNKNADYDENDAQQLTLLMEGMWRLIERKRGKDERKRLEEQLFQAQKMESVGRLAGGVAHDFNNTLGVIIGRTELAMQQGVSNDKLRNNLQEILQAGLRSADLTRQLLAFARKQTAVPKILDLNDTIPGMLKMFRRLIGEDADLSWQPGLDLWKIKIDPSQVDQILVNLVVNARDAISGAGTITMRTENIVIDDFNIVETPDFIPGEYVLLTVSDTGAGMSEEVLENIFEPFFTTKEVGKGTGLGLSTVYGIVKQNDGYIYVVSEPGKGATFKIYLPRFEVEIARVPFGDAARKPPTGTETILLVEDDEAILNLSKTILENLGYTVLATHIPADALHLAEEHPGDIHLLITDVVMPGINGRELAEQLSTIRPNLKCLYMSGYTADVIAHRGILDEGVGFIQKPFLSYDFAAKVKQVLDH